MSTLNKRTWKEGRFLNLSNSRGGRTPSAANQLPRNYENSGIEYEMMKTVKEDIIWLGMTGFGPKSNEAAYDPVLQARGD